MEPFVDAEFLPFRAFNRELLLVLRDDVESELNLCRVPRDIAPLQPIDIERHTVVHKHIFRSQSSRQPRDLWTEDEDVFILTTMGEIKASHREILDLYAEEFPTISVGRTTEQLRSRYRVLEQKQDRERQVKKEAKHRKKNGLPPVRLKNAPREGPLRVFSNQQLRLIQALLVDEQLARARRAVALRSPTPPEMVACASLLKVLPSISLRAAANCTDDSDDNDDDTTATDEIDDYQYRRLKRGSYTLEQDSWLLMSASGGTATSAPISSAEKISWCALSRDWQKAFPQAIKLTALQLHDRYGVLQDKTKRAMQREEAEQPHLDCVSTAGAALNEEVALSASLSPVSAQATTVPTYHLPSSPVDAAPTERPPARVIRKRATVVTEEDLRRSKRGKLPQSNRSK
jgi:hypothetical protein